MVEKVTILSDMAPTLFPRKENTPNMPSLEQSRQMLNRKNTTNDKINTQRAYKLLKRDQEIADSNKKWWSNLKQLSYD